MSKGLTASSNIRKDSLQDFFPIKGPIWLDDGSFDQIKFLNLENVSTVLLHLENVTPHVLGILLRKSLGFSYHLTFIQVAGIKDDFESIVTV